MKQWEIKLIRSDNTTAKILYVNNFQKAKIIATAWEVAYPTCSVKIKEV